MISRKLPFSRPDIRWRYFLTKIAQALIFMQFFLQTYSILLFCPNPYPV